MYFLPRNNRLYSFVAHIRPLYRYLMTFLCVTGLLYAWFFWVYVRLDNLIMHYTMDITKMYQEKLTFKKAEHDVSATIRVINAAQEKLEHYKQHSTVTEDKLQDMVTMILHTADQVGLYFNSCIIEKEYEKEGFINQVITFEVAGDYDNILLFCDSLAISKEIIEWDHIDVAHVDAHQVTVKCTLVISALKE